MFSKISAVLSRTIEFLIIALGVDIIIAEHHVLTRIGIWDALAVVYLLIRVSRFRRSKKAGGEESGDWLKGMLSPRIGTAFTLLTSVIGITSGVEIVLNKGNADAGLDANLVGVPAVLLAWAILHFGYAERYAQAYYAALPDTEILVFPNAVRPNFVDFAYFSFTMGTTFAVSDVESQNSSIRARILSHGILSFIYNTATLGIAVGVMTG